MLFSKIVCPHSTFLSGIMLGEQLSLSSGVANPSAIGVAERDEEGVKSPVKKRDDRVQSLLHRFTASAKPVDR